MEVNVIMSENRGLGALLAFRGRKGHLSYQDLYARSVRATEIIKKLATSGWNPFSFRQILPSSTYHHLPQRKHSGIN